MSNFEVGKVISFDFVLDNKATLDSIVGKYLKLQFGKELVHLYCLRAWTKADNNTTIVAKVVEMAN